VHRAVKTAHLMAIAVVFNSAFAQWADSNGSTVLPDYATTSSIDHTNDISLPATTKTAEIVSATSHMTNMGTGTGM